MTDRIALALAIHNHQPVGNFGWVFAEVHEVAYEPMVAALERHPGVRIALHYTGPLLHWFQAERPEFLDRLRALVARGQVEIMGGGFYEPVLASLPERDRIGQLRRMGDELETLFGRRPTGAWLAERVWEPDLPTSLVAGGYDWTILDDAHFRAATIAEEAMWGPYTTEDQGRLLRVFGTEQGLRYRIPFREVDDVIGYLRGHSTEDGSRVGMMGDDGEKFGAWPTTWEHCWGRGRYVERLFKAFEANADWLTMVTPSAWLADHPPAGRAYVPTGSYAEMGEWALPPNESRVFADVLHAAQAAGRPEARWLRGAFWRNFQVKYREINDLHKQMLRTSEKVEAMPAGIARERAIDHLYQGQSNDCYWHGMFGGIYISHMRLATHEHLIAAEDLADSALGSLQAAERLDLDMDGVDEVRLATPGQVVTVDLDEGAGIGAWDIRPVCHAVGAVMRRRPEAYHDVLRRQDDEDAGETPREGTATSIHEAVRVKEAGLAGRLFYDRYERRSGLVRFLSLDATRESWANAAAPELGDAVDGSFDLVKLTDDSLTVRRDAMVATGDMRAQVRATKRLRVAGDRRQPTLELTLDLEHVGATRLDARLGIEWTTTMLGGGHNPAAWWEFAGERSPHDGSGQASGVERFAQGNDYIGLAIETTVSIPADAWWAPVETVSNSEQGFERVYQGSGWLLSWPLALDPGDRWSVVVANTVPTDRDRAVEA